MDSSSYRELVLRRQCVEVRLQQRVHDPGQPRGVAPSQVPLGLQIQASQLGGGVSGQRHLGQAQLQLSSLEGEGRWKHIGGHQLRLRGWTGKKYCSSGLIAGHRKFRLLHYAKPYILTYVKGARIHEGYHRIIITSQVPEDTSAIQWSSFFSVSLGVRRRWNHFSFFFCGIAHQVTVCTALRNGKRPNISVPCGLTSCNTAYTQYLGGTGLQ